MLIYPGMGLCLMFVHLHMLQASNCSSVLMFVSFHDFRLPYWLLLVENHYLAALSSCNTLFILEPCWCRGKVLRWEAFYKLLIIFPCFRGAVNFTNDSPLMEFFLPLSPWTHLFYSIPNLFPWSLTLIDYDSFLIWCYRMAGSSEEGRSSSWEKVLAKPLPLETRTLLQRGSWHISQWLFYSSPGHSQKGILDFFTVSI